MDFNPDATTIIIALISLLGVQSAAVVWFGRWAANRFSKDLVAHTQATNKQTIAAGRQVTSNEKVAAAVTSFDTYLRERNGRDGEVHTELMKQMHENTKVLYSVEKQRTIEHKALLEAIPAGVTEMHVDKQIIDKVIKK